MCYHLGSLRDCLECKNVSSMESFMIAGEEVFYECKICGCKLIEDRMNDKWIINIYKHGEKNWKKIHMV